MLPLISLIPSIMTAITKVAAVIGPMLAKYAPIVVDLAGKYLPKIIETVEKISTVLNIIKPSDNAEVLGAKVISSDKNPEDFETINSYVDYLHKEITVDKTTLSTEPVDVLARQAIGVSILMKGASEALGTELTIPFIKAVSRLDLDANLIVEVAKAYASNDLKLDDYEKYISKELPTNQLDTHSDVIVIAYQKSDPTMSLEQAEDKVMALELSKNDI